MYSLPGIVHHYHSYVDKDMKELELSSGVL